MTRTRNPERLESILEAATYLFTSTGYRRTQVSDVARRAGVAQGTVYLYAESKEALFDLVVRHAATGDRDVATKAGKHTATSESTLKFIEKWASKITEFPALRSALSRKKVINLRRELEDIIGELFDTIEENRHAIRLIEKATLDWPKLHSTYYGKLRRRVIRNLESYIELRIKQKHFRITPDIRATARLVVETCAWFAKSRPDDPGPVIDRDAAKSTVVDVLVHGLISNSAS